MRAKEYKKSLNNSSNRCFLGWWWWWWTFRLWLGFGGQIKEICRWRFAVFWSFGAKTQWVWRGCSLGGGRWFAELSGRILILETRRPPRSPMRLARPRVEQFQWTDSVDLLSSILLIAPIKLSHLEGNRFHKAGDPHGTSSGGRGYPKIFSIEHLALSSSARVPTKLARAFITASSLVPVWSGQSKSPLSYIELNWC